MDIYVVSVSWLLWIVLLWIKKCMYIFKFYFCLDIRLGVGLLGHMVTPCSVYRGTSMLFSIAAAPIYIPINSVGGSPGGSDGKESACNVGAVGSTPGLGRSSGESNSNPLQYFCLENSMDRGAWGLQSMGLQSWTQQLTYTEISVCNFRKWISGRTGISLKGVEQRNLDTLFQVQGQAKQN